MWKREAAAHSSSERRSIIGAALPYAPLWAACKLFEGDEGLLARTETLSGEKREAIDPFQKPNDPMDIRVDPSKRTTQQLFRGFMHSLGERTEGNDFNKGALDCALGIVNRDERYLGIYEFCVWYYKLLKKEGLIDEGPVRES